MGPATSASVGCIPSWPARNIDVAPLRSGTLKVVMLTGAISRGPWLTGDAKVVDTLGARTLLRLLTHRHNACRGPNAFPYECKYPL